MSKIKLQAANVCAARAMRNDALETTVTSLFRNRISRVGLAEHTKVTAGRAAIGSLDILLSFNIGKCHRAARNLFKLVDAVIILHRFGELSTKIYMNSLEASLIHIHIRNKIFIQPRTATRRVARQRYMKRFMVS